ncbi:hypothetical protein AB1Y20_011236 [Prymnesium parvum]|uniref:Peroxisomal membrane protein PEX16 n=1 Tax=Prymnesium parvum TaxID=97485 RepID=A0AB34INQ8_PRYPA|eukprot:CAMPEP_0184380402 /NCGR_PEP_ID=MMETSP0007-20130409/4710_1 /TAXON_ID=97485 /ORGANISM="Prymnesium parvum, Strain Texoma1" /LENGTH=108 /DNA_ID=CAMNT_0026725603 /DNA_START=12 /DNA_END=338 /DNA_ORIENTATION=+
MAAAQLVSEKGKQLALAYAWGKVCFTSWDTTLEQLAGLCAWGSWPPALRQLLHAVYPAYFVYASARRLAGPEGPSAREVARYLVILLAAAALLALKGARDGIAARKAS